jgi:beta-galactosidase
MILGVDYYPEHWPQERWEIDAALMKKAGLDVVRIGEFAWGLMEPEQDHFEWDWLDQAIEVLSSAGLQVVLGTPTAAPPAWLTYTYPDTLPVDEAGRRRNFGGRRHYCANSADYRERTRRIVSAMASRYGSHPAVTGWQIDNEFGGGHSARCYCPNCAAAFREWLRRRYENLSALNLAWGSVFWSQSYTAWEQINPPNLTVELPNPSQVLDYYRFSSDSWVEYQQIQLDILRKVYEPRQFITHNFMGLFHDLDYHKLARQLDFVTWDSYPSGHLERWLPEMLFPQDGVASSGLEVAYDAGAPLITGMGHDLTRGLKRAPFWVMEQQCGNINWGSYNPGIRPLTVRLWTWHAVASGAVGVVFFRWRACLFAQEQYHSGLLHHDASPDIGYEDLAILQEERQLLDKIAGQPFETPVAMVLSYDDLWALQIQPHHQDFSYLRHSFVYYRALSQLGIQVDIVPPDADLDQYQLVISASSILADERRAAYLAEYVSQGGSLLFGVRSGFNTLTKVVTDQPLPGPYHPLTGATITSWHSLPPGIGYELESSIDGLSGSAKIWAESLLPDDGTRSLAQFRSGPFAGAVAISENRLGNGTVYYCGIVPDAYQAESLIRHVLSQAGIHTGLKKDASVFHIRRGKYTILLNFSDQPKVVEIQGQKYPVSPRDISVLEVE